MIKEDFDLDRFCSDGMFEYYVDAHEKFLKTQGMEGERINMWGMSIGGIWQSDINLSASVFVDCDFEGSPVDGVNFSYSIFKNCNFEKTTFKDCQFREATFINCANPPMANADKQ